MKSELIIIFAFASFVQSYSNLTVSYGLSEDQLAILSELVLNQKASIDAYSDGFKPVFERLNGLLVESECNLSADESTKLIRGLGRANNAVDLSFDSIHLVLGKSCSGVPLAREAAHRYLEDIFTRISNALALAKFGNDSRNRAAIEVHWVAVQTDLKNLLKSVDDSICVCLDICKDSETLAVIENTYYGSRVGLIHLANAVFNAIKEYAAVVAYTGYSDVSLVPDIEEFQCKAFVGIKKDAEYRFSALRTFYINSIINKTGIVSGLAAIQYAQTVATNRYTEGTEAAFRTVSNYLRRIALEFQDDGEDDFTRTDAALDTVIAKFDAGHVAIFSSFLILYPSSSDEILKAQKEIFAAEDVGVFALYEAIYAAVDRGNNYTMNRRKIETIRNATIPLASNYAGFFFRFIRDGQSFGEKIEDELKTLNVKAIHVDQIVIDKFFDAVLILARANSEGKVREDDFIAIKTLLDTANSRLNDFTGAIAAACLTVLTYKL